MGGRVVDVRPADVRDDALPDPGGRRRGLVPGRVECGAESIVREVDGHVVECPGQRGQVADPVALVLLRGRMVDLEHVDVGELGHAPGTSVQAGAEDHRLRSPALAHRVVDGDRARHHDLGTGPHHLERDALTPSLWRCARAYLLDGNALVGAEQRHRRRVGEPAGRDAFVRGCTTLADEHGGLARALSLHA